MNDLKLKKADYKYLAVKKGRTIKELTEKYGDWEANEILTYFRKMGLSKYSNEKGTYIFTAFKS